MKFQKKPIVVDAYRWDGNFEKVCKFLESLCKPASAEIVGHRLAIRTEDTTLWPLLGEWIICGVFGNFYTLSDEVLMRTYDLKEEEPESKTARPCTELPSAAHWHEAYAGEMDDIEEVVNG